MSDGPQHIPLDCPDCSERLVVEVPEDPKAWMEHVASCSRGHRFQYDEYELLVPPGSTEGGSR